MDRRALAITLLIALAAGLLVVLRLYFGGQIIRTSQEARYPGYALGPVDVSIGVCTMNHGTKPHGQEVGYECNSL